MRYSFASDNVAGAHPECLKALARVAEIPYAPAYGADTVTEAADAKFREHFGPTARAFFVFNGSAANVLAISSFLRPYEAVLAPETSHLENDECGAFERFAGSKTLLLPTKNGKIDLKDVEARLNTGRGDPHHVQPRLLTITQSTECGTVYQPGEIRALADLLHRNGMFLHVDGARFSNAAARLNLGLKALSADLGVDVLSFGGTKNGLLLGEAVVFFGNAEVAKNFPFVRKQGLQLASKMRFLAGQFETVLTEDIWLKGARHANAMADRLAAGIRDVKGVEIAYPVEANAVFAKLPRASLEKLQKDFHFYVWDADEGIARLMASFETKPEHVDALILAIRELA